jgi:hypothetical protein
MNESITYSSHFEFNGCRLAFRKKMLFDITSTPRLIPTRKATNGSEGCYVKRKWLPLSKATDMAKGTGTIAVDVSDLQWYQQEQLNHCFNLT